MKKILLLIFGGIIGMQINASSNPYIADYKWGTVAIDGQNKIWANSYGLKTKEEAEQEAVKLCREMGGKNGCNESKITFSNGIYTAIAVSSDGTYGIVCKKKEDEAKKQALINCEKSQKKCELIAIIDDEGKVTVIKKCSEVK